MITSEQATYQRVVRTAQGRQGKIRAVDWYLEVCLVMFETVPHLQAVPYAELSVIEIEVVNAHSRMGRDRG